jgi:hypothetical protein
VEVGAHAGLAARRRHATSRRPAAPPPTCRRHASSSLPIASHALLGAVPANHHAEPGGAGRSHVFWLRKGDSAPESAIRGAPAGATPEAADGALPKGLEVL